MFSELFRHPYQELVYVETSILSIIYPTIYAKLCII